MLMYFVKSSAVLFINGIIRVFCPFPVSRSVEGFSARKSLIHKSAMSCTRAALSDIRLYSARSLIPCLVEVSTASRIDFIPSTVRYSILWSGSFFLGIDNIC